MKFGKKLKSFKKLFNFSIVKKKKKKIDLIDNFWVL